MKGPAAVGKGPPAAPAVGGTSRPTSGASPTVFIIIIIMLFYFIKKKISSFCPFSFSVLFFVSSSFNLVFFSFLKF